MIRHKIKKKKEQTNKQKFTNHFLKKKEKETNKKNNPMQTTTESVTIHQGKTRRSNPKSSISLQKQHSSTCMHAYLISEVRCRVNYSYEILRGDTRKIEGMGLIG